MREGQKKRIFKTAIFIIVFTFIKLNAQAPTANDATNITQVSFTANWTPNSAAPAYYLTVAKDAGFTDIVSPYNNLDVGIGTSYNVTSGLSANTLYYYKVAVSGFASPYLYSNTITLRTGPVNPVASAATDITLNSATANWNSDENVVYYQVMIAKNSAFTDGVNSYGVEEGNSCNLSDLHSGTQYWYKVKATNTYGGVSGYSNVISFTTLSNTPSAPIASAASQITQTGFVANWNSVSGADGYLLDVAKDNIFRDVLDDYNSLNVGNTTVYSVSGLSPNTSYYYRLRAYNGFGNSENSNTVSLTTLINVPDAPEATEATTINNTSFYANWNASSGADGYYLDVSIDNTFNTFIAGFNGKDVGNALTFQVTGLSANTTYYYRVSGYNSGGTGSYSNIISTLTMPDVPSVPVALDATFVGENEFTANWNGVNSADGYYLDVADGNTFTTCISGYEGRDVGNVNSYNVTGLSIGKYYYRLRAYNISGESPNSNVISVFITRPRPQAPVLNTPTPVDNSSFSANWNATAETDGYRIDISTDENFTNFVGDYNSKDVGISTSVTVTGLTFNFSYYVRVRAYNDGGESDNSNVVSFSFPVSVDDTGLPGDYHLYQNYPNPFNPATIIKFSLRKSSFVSIIVYDVSGREVGTLTKREYNSGSHFIRFNAADLSNGVYFYRIITSEFSDIKKMILLK